MREHIVVVSHQSFIQIALKFLYPEKNIENILIRQGSITTITVDQLVDTIKVGDISHFDNRGFPKETPNVLHQAFVDAIQNFMNNDKY